MSLRLRPHTKNIPMSNAEVFQAVLSGGGLESLDNLTIPHPSGRLSITRIGLRASIKFQNGHTPEKRQACLRVMRSFYEAFKDHITHWLPPDPAQQSLLRVEPDQFPIPDSPEAVFDADENFDVELFGFLKAQKKREPCLYQAGVLCMPQDESRKNSYFEANIPLSWAVAHTFDSVRELVRTWSSILEAVHGTTGISLLFNDPNEYLRYSFFLLKKFPGIDYEDPSQFNLQVNSARSGGIKPFKIRTVSWLTILGTPIVEELGGRQLIAAELGPSCPIFDYSGGIVIQAMPVPQLGSMEDGLIPEGYKKVAKVTKPVRFEAYHRGIFENLPTPLDNMQETLSWLRRFD